MSNESRPARVTVISLGGTIAATTDADPVATTVVPQLTARDLVDAVPQLRDVAVVETLALRTIPSCDLTFENMIELAAAIDARIAAGASGVVITQGTDTIEETSFALDLLVRSSAPVVVTGAMRNPSLAGPDGPANLLAAVQVASDPSASGLGTLVVMNDEIHAARFVRKTHSTSPSTFHSPSAGPLGWLSEGRVRIVVRVAPLDRIAVVRGGVVPPVALISAALGDSAPYLGSLETLGYEGVVIEGFGGGHVPARMVAALEELAGRMPVVLASRTGAGEVLRGTYGFAGSESDLFARGLLSAGLLDGRKARVFLSLRLAAGDNLTAARDGFDRMNSLLAHGDGH